MSIVASPTHIPTYSVGVFPFLHILSSFVICKLFDGDHYDWYDMIPHCSFDLHFSIRDIKHLFMYLLAICMSSLDKCLFRSSAHFKNIYLFLAGLCLPFCACTFLIMSDVEHHTNKHMFVSHLYVFFGEMSI